MMRAKGISMVLIGERKKGAIRHWAPFHQGRDRPHGDRHDTAISLDEAVVDQTSSISLSMLGLLALYCQPLHSTRLDSAERERKKREKVIMSAALRCWPAPCCFQKREQQSPKVSNTFLARQRGLSRGHIGVRVDGSTHSRHSSTARNKMPYIIEK